MPRLVLLLLLLVYTDTSSWGQDFTVAPMDALADSELSIEVTGLQSGQLVLVRSAMKDSQGEIWGAEATFRSNRDGTVNLAKDAPESGDYSGVDVMGLIHAMQPPVENPFSRFTLSLNKPMVVQFSLEIDGEIHKQADVVRRILSPDLEIAEVRTDGLVGRFYKPPGEGPFPGVLVLGGSSGGMSGAVKAGLLASHGFAVLTVAYFSEDGLPSHLENIPLEYFKKGIDWLSAKNSVVPGGVAVFGTSKGAEAALLLGSQYPEIQRVVAVVPSSVVWRCICLDEDASSWSLNGSPLPFVTPQDDPTYQPVSGAPFRATTRYLQGLKDEALVDAARIPVEKIGGPILLVSGTDDQLWPSYVMSEMIMSHLASSDFSHSYEHLAMEGAGHSIRSTILPLAGTTTNGNGRLSFGGSYEGIRGSQASWEKIIAFLGEGN